MFAALASLAMPSIGNAVQNGLASGMSGGTAMPATSGAITHGATQMGGSKVINFGSSAGSVAAAQPTPATTTAAAPLVTTTNSNTALIAGGILFALLGAVLIRRR